MRAVMGIEFLILQNGFSKNEMGLRDYWQSSCMECKECGSSNVKLIKSETVCMECYTVLDEGVYSGQMLI